jgi:hypothetical protein
LALDVLQVVPDPNFFPEALKEADLLHRGFDGRTLTVPEQKSRGNLGIPIVAPRNFKVGCTHLSKRLSTTMTKMVDTSPPPPPPQDEEFA